MTPHTPTPLSVATQAQQMARHTRDQRMEVAFQWIAMTSMAIMGVTAAANLIREMLHPPRGRGRS